MPYDPTLAEAAIRYSLSPGAVATVIPGMSNPAEVDMNVAYSDGAERGELDLDQPIATFWPEFARNGPQTITTRTVLAQRAGLPP